MREAPRFRLDAAAKDDIVGDGPEPAELVLGVAGQEATLEARWLER
jgi:hypothetical protein